MAQSSPIQGMIFRGSYSGDDFQGILFRGIEGVKLDIGKVNMLYHKDVGIEVGNDLFTLLSEG
jgi:hypothetical protein